MTALPLSSSPFRHCIVVARLFAICSVIRVLSAYAKGGMAILIANRIMHFFVPLLCAINHATRMLCTHQHTHTHERAINSTFIRANLIYCLQLAGQKDTALKAFQCKKIKQKKYQTVTTVLIAAKSIFRIGNLFKMMKKLI